MSGSGLQPRHDSGAKKRARAKQQQEEIAKLPKISAFFTVSQARSHLSDNEGARDSHVIREREYCASSSDERTPLDDTYRFSNDTTTSRSSLTKSDQQHQVVQPMDSDSGDLTKELNQEQLEHHNVTANVVSHPTYPSDPALWKRSEDSIKYCLRFGPRFCQNKDSDFEKSRREYQGANGKIKIRKLQKSLFEYVLEKNGELIEREWMLYSPSTGAIFCFFCRLFSNKDISFSSTGFSDWRNDRRRVEEHENGSEHKDSIKIYMKRKCAMGCIDEKIAKQFDDEYKHWQNVIRRLISAIKFLASRGLAFRGTNQEIGSTKNGNYLGVLELLSEYDPFLKNHIELYANKGRGHTSYLSANVCEELIELMGKKVLVYVINEIRKYKYYTVSLDSSPDSSRTDQLTFIVRETRWSARAKSVSALHDGYDEVQEALRTIEASPCQDNDAKLEARSLQNKLSQFDNIFLLVVWDKVLSQIDKTNQSIQKEQIDLSIIVSLLNSLEQFLQSMRVNKFTELLEKAKEVARVDEIPELDRRTRVRSVRVTRFEGAAPHTVVTGEERLRIELFYPIIDCICSELARRRIAYDEAYQIFDFFLHLGELDDNQIEDKCKKISEKYDADVSENDLISECIQFKCYLISSNSNEKITFLSLYQKIRRDSLRSTFPNLEICLRIFLCKMVTNCSGERSFSQMKIVKNDHRSTMLDSRLNYLSIMCIESDILQLLDTEGIISEFAYMKTRRKL
ncbi:hypothetical protein QAD02_020655 [Eretmocerus hayati]|uniref:Uncharacterized protein n=1 Tax=Eretmocerus hayati TaxID=131215 RepID=A0ACC2PN75_9HYME|nr:hypothetical protein QAD02_020655 [Eretmocerus hayati]